MVEPENSEELYDTILKLKDDPALRKNLGEKGRKFLEENMDLEKNVGLYEGIFEIITCKDDR